MAQETRKAEVLSVLACDVPRVSLAERDWQHGVVKDPGNGERRSLRQYLQTVTAQTCTLKTGVAFARQPSSTKREHYLGKQVIC